MKQNKQDQRTKRTEQKPSHIGHLGAIAAHIEELDLVACIDTHVKQDQERRNMSAGSAVKSMLLMMLGFVPRRLYLAHKYFENKPIEELLWRGCRLEDLSEGALGRALDTLHTCEGGLEGLFSRISEQILRKIGLEAPQSIHMDTTTIHVEGEYNSETYTEADAESGIVHITRGYSKDGKPDANQIVLNLISEQRAGIPLAMAVCNGNTSDKAEFKRCVSTVIDKFLKGYEPERNPVLVMDSAGYIRETTSNASQKGCLFVSRAPRNLKITRRVVSQAFENQSKFVSLNQDYEVQSFRSSENGIAQRFLVFRGQAREVSSEKLILSKFKKAVEKEGKLVKSLEKKTFSCSQDAASAVEALRKPLEYSEIEKVEIVSQAHHAKRGRPTRYSEPDSVSYRVILEVKVPDEMPKDLFEFELFSKRCFVLATNQLDESALSDLDVLLTYKKQSKVERGFRFLKDKMFQVSTVFVKKPERLASVAFLMSVSLALYASLEYLLRQNLSEKNATIPNQKGKPTNHPTLRWVFELLSDAMYLDTFDVDTGEILKRETWFVHDDLLKLFGYLGGRYASFYASG